MPKIIQIQAVRFANFFSKQDNIALFGISGEGVVYQYRFDTDPEGWRKLEEGEVADRLDQKEVVHG